MITGQILPDHPVIRSMERTGYPDGAATHPVCPMCGEEAEVFYKAVGNLIVGCDGCIVAVDAEEEPDG